MRVKHLLTAAAFGLVVTVGFAEDTKRADKAAGETADKAGDNKAFDDAEFIKKAASGGMHEVALGKLAAEQGHSDAVKKFGEKMQTDHTKANLELLEVAKAAKITVPDQMNEHDQKHVDHFKTMKGEEFDKHYVEHMAKDHEKDIKEFNRASKEAKNPALKEFAAKTLPTLNEHWEMVKKMQDGKK